MVHTRPRHRSGLAFAALLVLLALPALHPGAWAHGAFDLARDATGVEVAPDAPPSLRAAHLTCPLCRALAQARTALSEAEALRSLAGSAATRLLAGAPEPAAPAAPVPAGPRARAPPLPA